MLRAWFAPVFLAFAALCLAFDLGWAGAESVHDWHHPLPRVAIFAYTAIAFVLAGTALWMANWLGFERQPKPLRSTSLTPAFGHPISQVGTTKAPQIGVSHAPVP